MKPIIFLLTSLLIAGAMDTSWSADAPVKWEGDLVQPVPPVPVDDQKHLENLQHAKNGLEVAEKFVDIFNSSIFEKSGVAKVAEIVTKSLSFIGAIINLIMGIIAGNVESAEMKFMRDQFKEVNAKLDSISLKIDDVKDLIDWRTARLTYANYEIDIQKTSHLLDDFVTASAQDREFRKRLFIDDFKQHRLAAFALYQAITTNSHVLADNLATAAMHYTKNHRSKVLSFLLTLQRTIMRGAQMEIAYVKLEFGESQAAQIEATWKSRLVTLVNRLKEVNDQIMNVWHKQMETDVDHIVSGEVTRDLPNKEFSIHLYRYLNDKFDWLHWFVISYNAVTGWHVHTIGGCRINLFRTSPGRSRNLVVAWSDKRWSRFTQEKGDAWLEAAESARHGTADASVWQREIEARINGDCNDAALRATICWGCDVWFSGRSDRYSYRRINVHGNLHAFIFG